jgi:hypothetical protein
MHMAKNTPSLGAAVEGAFEEAYEGTAEEAEAPATPEPTPEATDGAQAEPASETPSDTGSENPPEASGEVTDGDVERYFEVDLSGLPAEERQAIVAALKARDDQIGKLLRGETGTGTGGEATPEGEAPEPPQPMSDEDIIRGLGLDPDNPFDENAAKVALPLVRTLQDMKATVDQLVEARELEALDRVWTSELDRLERDNGALPIDRTAVLEFAAANQLYSPEDAYWRIAGPARAQVETLAREARERLPKPETPAPVRKPSAQRPTAGGGTEEVPTQAVRLKDAVGEEAAKVLRDLGIG